MHKDIKCFNTSVCKELLDMMNPKPTCSIREVLDIGDETFDDSFLMGVLAEAFLDVLEDPAHQFGDRLVRENQLFASFTNLQPQKIKN